MKPTIQKKGHGGLFFVTHARQNEISLRSSHDSWINPTFQPFSLLAMMSRASTSSRSSRPISSTVGPMPVLCQCLAVSFTHRIKSSRLPAMHGVHPLDVLRILPLTSKGLQDDLTPLVIHEIHVAHVPMSNESLLAAKHVLCSSVRQMHHR